MDTMPNHTLPEVNKQRYRWLRLGSILILGLVAPFFLFSLYYYDNHMEQQEIRVFRTLQELDQAIDQRIENMLKIYEKAVKPNNFSNPKDIEIKIKENQADLKNINSLLLNLKAIRIKRIQDLSGNDQVNDLIYEYDTLLSSKFEITQDLNSQFNTVLSDIDRIVIIYGEGKQANEKINQLRHVLRRCDDELTELISNTTFSTVQETRFVVNKDGLMTTNLKSCSQVFNNNHRQLLAAVENQDIQNCKLKQLNEINISYDLHTLIQTAQTNLQLLNPANILKNKGNELKLFMSLNLRIRDMSKLFSELETNKINCTKINSIQKSIGYSLSVWTEYKEAMSRLNDSINELNEQVDSYRKENIQETLNKKNEITERINNFNGNTQVVNDIDHDIEMLKLQEYQIVIEHKKLNKSLEVAQNEFNVLDSRTSSLNSIKHTAGLQNLRYKEEHLDLGDIHCQQINGVHVKNSLIKAGNNDQIMLSIMNMMNTMIIAIILMYLAFRFHWKTLSTLNHLVCLAGLTNS